MVRYPFQNHTASADFVIEFCTEAEPGNPPLGRSLSDHAQTTVFERVRRPDRRNGRIIRKVGRKSVARIDQM
jgi:hypothetical protein